MIPIQDLLKRIRWDPNFGQGDFEIGYYDRVKKEIVRVPLSGIRFDRDDHYSFELTNSDGECHMIPLHRVKQVFKDGSLIWHRER